MATLSEVERIAQIDDILAGPRTVTINDRTVVYDFDALKAERNKLQRTIAQGTTSSFRRVVFKSG